MGFWSSIFGKRGSYFLDDESAKGLGDTEYMKQSKAVRRTFPAGGGDASFEVTKQVSAMAREVYDSRKGATPPPTSSYAATSSSSFGSSSFGSSSFGSSTPSTETGKAAEAPATESADKAPEPSFQPSRSMNVDTNLDMFRNMAKKVGR